MQRVNWLYFLNGLVNGEVFFTIRIEHSQNCCRVCSSQRKMHLMRQVIPINNLYDGKHDILNYLLASVIQLITKTDTTPHSIGFNRQGRSKDDTQNEVAFLSNLLCH